ncbi:MFS transporter [Saccharopolyspora sp. NPDC047091]|uniref:MFS transporter n=1 Tax=Saccharopolyspora sp. NPDC047091 TaxID=3155924 RepID=UPI0033EAF057
MPLTAATYLASHLLSLLGNGIAAVALPLIVLQTTGSPLGTAVLAGATAVPAVLVGLLGGVVVDRINRRTASAVADLVSAVSVAALPLVDLGWGLNLTWFVVLGIVGSFGDVPGTTAREVLAPVVARHAGIDMARLIGLRQAASSAALVIGPAAAGLLLAAFDPTSVLWITAGTSALAALLTRTLPRHLGEVEGTAAPRRSVLRELGEGFAVVGRSRFLLGTSGLVVGLAVALGGLQGMVLPLYFDLIARPDLLGLVLTALAAGMLGGAALYSGVGGRWSTRTWLAAGFAGTTAGFLLMASLLSPAVVFAGAAALGLGNSVVGAVTGVLQVERTSSAVRGRVLSFKTTLLTIAAPAGIGLAGVVAEFGSPVLAGFSVAAVWVLVLLAVLGSRALAEQVPTAPVAEPVVAQG